MEEIVVRLLGPEHILDVHAVWKEAGLPYHPSGRDSVGRMSREITDPRSFLVGAYRGEALLGVALGTDDGRKGWINRVAVRPDCQKRGVAGALVDFCERRFKSQGLGLVCALIEEANAPSRRLFAREGYEERTDIHYFRKRIAGEDW